MKRARKVGVGRKWFGRGLVGAAAAALLVLTSGVAAATTASPNAGMATGAVAYEGFGTVSIALMAQGSPEAARGQMHFRRDAEGEGFDANSGGPVTCYLQVGNRGYFAGEFARTFFSGPTEIRFFNGIVVDGDALGEADRAFVTLGADAPIPCDNPGMMAFLDSVSRPVVRGNIIVH
jgi:hypothetical protein